MTEQRKVYLVTQGRYSDYHVEAVFSTKEKAQAWIDSSREQGCEIEEWDIDSPIERGWVTSIVMMRDGVLWGHSESALPIWSKLPPPPYKLYWYASVGCYLLRNAVYTSREDAPIADHHARAVKVTNELRARLIATDEWPCE